MSDILLSLIFRYSSFANPARDDRSDSWLFVRCSSVRLVANSRPVRSRILALSPSRFVNCTQFRYHRHLGSLEAIVKKTGFSDKPFLWRTLGLLLGWTVISNGGVVFRRRVSELCHTIVAKMLHGQITYGVTNIEPIHLLLFRLDHQINPSRLAR